ncbi:MAG: ABC transporter permease [Clostridiaceae bacterium]|nr:ABC transporter permease [Clostridiaceae bacterium]
MFAHIFNYRLKCLLRDKTTVFWTFAFPLILAVFFQLAFSNIGSEEIFRAIDIAVVDDLQYQEDQYFKLALDEASNGDSRLFNLTVTTAEEAQRLLDENLIKGYITVDTPIKLVVKGSGLSQSIIKSYIDNYSQTFAAVSTIIQNDPTNHQEVIKSLADRKNYIKEVTGTGAEPNSILNYFYSLIAMACFYGGFFGMRETTDIQADISTLAARINVAPVHKLKAFLYSLCAALLIHSCEMLALLGFMHYVLKIDFGFRVGYLVLTTIIGSIAGVLMGALISTVVKKSEGMKVAVVLTISMFGSFLSGMMFQDMKYIVAQNVPILSYINPINLLTDALYSLYYYGNLSRYFLNMAFLSAFTILATFGTYLILRRRKYASL